MEQRWQVVILAAGVGSRMRPLTAEIPKCMITINKVSLLDRCLNALDILDEKKIFLVAGYLYDKITIKRIDRVVVNRDYESTNMCYSLWTAIDLISNDRDLVLSYGDIVYQTNVVELLKQDKSELISTVIDSDWSSYWSARMEHPADDVESLMLDTNGYLESIGQPVRDLDEIAGQYIGLVKIPANKIDNFKRLLLAMKQENEIHFRNAYMTDFLQYCIKQGELIKPLFTIGGWLEFDQVSDIEAGFKSRPEVLDVVQ